MDESAANAVLQRFDAFEARLSSDFRTIGQQLTTLSTSIDTAAAVQSAQMEMVRSAGAWLTETTRRPMIAYPVYLWMIGQVARSLGIDPVQLIGMFSGHTP